MEIALVVGLLVLLGIGLRITSASNQKKEKLEDLERRMLRMPPAERERVFKEIRRK